MARSDMFLKATGQRTGVIVGESVDKAFTGQIDVVDWSWGMTTPSAVGGQRTGRTLMGELKFVKRADKASTALMVVMKNNEILTSVVLSVRKAGGHEPLPYFVVTLEQARINAYNVASDIGGDGAPTLTEHLSLTFKRVTIDHTVQSDRGANLGSSSFVGEVSPD